MQFSVLFPFVCLIFLSFPFVCSELFFISTAVVELNDATFHSTISQGDWVVNFYAHTCLHCRNIKQTYINLADEFQRNSDSSVRLAAVNCLLNPSVAQTEHIREHPTIAYFKQGQRVGVFANQMPTKDNLRAFIDRPSFMALNTQTQRSQQQQQSQQQQFQSAFTRPPPSAQSFAPTTQPSQQESSSSSHTSTASHSPNQHSHQSSTHFSAERLLHKLSSLLSLDTLLPQSVSSFQSELLEVWSLLLLSHPVLIVGSVWIIGLIQGIFIGSVFVLKEKRAIES